MRNFTRLCIFLLFFPCFWSGCNDRSVRHRMLEAEARFDTVPSDIFRLLSEVGSPDSLSSEDRALYGLLTLRSYSIRGKPLPDSLVRHVYAYYHATDDSLHRAPGIPLYEPSPLQIEIPFSPMVASPARGRTLRAYG